MKQYQIKLLELTRGPEDKALRCGVLKLRHETIIEARNFSYAQNEAFAFYGSDGRGASKSLNHYKFKIRVREISS